MNEFWCRYARAYRQSKKTSPPSATAFMQLGVGDRIFVDHGLTGTSPFWWLGLFFVLIVVG
jgi:hypothetical protein